jgi:hypothetical protein
MGGEWNSIKIIRTSVGDGVAGITDGEPAGFAAAVFV